MVFCYKYQSRPNKFKKAFSHHLRILGNINNFRFRNSVDGSNFISMGHYPYYYESTEEFRDWILYLIDLAHIYYKCSKCNIVQHNHANSIFRKILDIGTDWLDNILSKN